MSLHIFNLISQQMLVSFLCVCKSECVLHSPSLAVILYWNPWNWFWQIGLISLMVWKDTNRIYGVLSEVWVVWCCVHKWVCSDWGWEVWCKAKVQQTNIKQWWWSWRLALHQPVTRTSTTICIIYGAGVLGTGFPPCSVGDYQDAETSQNVIRMTKAKSPPKPRTHGEHTIPESREGTGQHNWSTNLATPPPHRRQETQWTTSRKGTPDPQHWKTEQNKTKTKKN